MSTLVTLIFLPTTQATPLGQEVGEARGQAYSRCSEKLVDFTNVWVAFEGQALYPGLSSLKSTWLFPMGWLSLAQLIKAPGTLTVS